MVGDGGDGGKQWKTVENNGKQRKTAADGGGRRGTDGRHNVVRPGPSLLLVGQVQEMTLTFPTQSAPSSEFLSSHKPFPDIVNMVLLNVAMS